MMRIDIATLFPDMCEAVMSESIVGRARKAGYIQVHCHNIRDYTKNKHRRVDDKPYGGGYGMVMQAQPVYDCITDIKRENPDGEVIYMSPQGKTLTQDTVKELAAKKGLIILCGHYEGVDDRVLEELCVREISVGDYVLTGGELPALILADAVARLCDGVLPAAEAFTDESHYDGLLEHPQYSRPEVWKDRRVPDVLLTGAHGDIEKWRSQAAYDVTLKKRPDLLYGGRRDKKPFGRYVGIYAVYKGQRRDICALALMLSDIPAFKNKEIKRIRAACALAEDELAAQNAARTRQGAVLESENAPRVLEILSPVFDIFEAHNIEYNIVFSDITPENGV